MPLIQECFFSENRDRGYPNLPSLNSMTILSELPGLSYNNIILFPCIECFGDCYVMDIN